MYSGGLSFVLKKESPPDPERKFAYGAFRCENPVIVPGIHIYKAGITKLPYVAATESVHWLRRHYVGDICRLGAR